MVADFRRTGLTHLVAVSGTNLAIVTGVVLGAARRLRVGSRTAGMCAAVSLLAFVVVARPSASVLRAAVMGLLAVVGLLTGRRRSALSSVCAAVLILVLLDPTLARDAGFALSVLATGGLLVLAPGIQQLLSGYLPEPVATALGAWVRKGQRAAGRAWGEFATSGAWTRWRNWGCEFLCSEFVSGLW